MEASEDTVNDLLKGLGSLSETEWHSKEFKHSKWCINSGLSNIRGFNRDLMVSTDKVYLRKIMLPARMVVKTLIWEMEYRYRTVWLFSAR